MNFFCSSSVALIAAKKQCQIFFSFSPLSLVHMVKSLFLSTSARTFLWHSWRLSVENKCKFHYPDARENNVTLKLSVFLPECALLFCFLCLSSVHSLMATPNAFPLNSGVVFHRGNRMDLGHGVAASLLMSSNLAIAPTRAEQGKWTEKKNKKHFALQSLGWMPNSCVFKGCQWMQREMKEQGQHVFVGAFKIFLWVCGRPA